MCFALAVGCASNPQDQPKTQPTNQSVDLPQDMAPDLRSDLGEMALDVSPDAQEMMDQPMDMVGDQGEDDGGDMPVADQRGLCPQVMAKGGRPKLPGTNPGATPPFGTGQSSDVILGKIADANGPPQPVSSFAVSLTEDLETRTYDVYVPEDYDGSEAYGLVVFINSGDNGGGPNRNYLPQFKSDKLIQVAPDGAGNRVNVDVRMGLALLGAIRAMELFNIDPSRVYAMGNSGGARTANMLAYQYPDLFTGAMPRCGANYPRQVDQDYETREPDSHYEFWGSGYFPSVGGMAYLDYLRSKSLRFALMTSFGDFREGDMLNIYHNGMEQDQLHARLLQRPGGHCATGAAHFADAMGWIEHPLHEVIKDTFETQTLSEQWLTLSGTATINGGQLKLSAASQQVAAILSQQRIQWDDRHGAVIRAHINPGDLSTTRLALWPFDATRHAKGSFNPPTTPDAADKGLIAVSIERQGNTAAVVVHVAKQGEAAMEIFRAGLEDWAPDKGPIELRVDAWQAELQIDTQWHLKDATMTTGAMLLNDRRTIRVRWDQLLPNGWGQTDWSNGSAMTLSVEANAQETSATIDNVSVHDGAGFTCQ